MVSLLPRAPIQAVQVLIADSEPQSRQETRQLVEMLGHVVVGEASEPTHTLALARALRPDAVILDVDLGARGGGLETARTLSGERVAALLLVGGDAACASADTRERASQIGVQAFLAKPLRGDDLALAVVIASGQFRELVALEIEIRSLHEQMEARKLVGRAKAILMERYGLAERDAFRRIQNQSMALNKPVSQIARAIITASEIPL